METVNVVCFYKNCCQAIKPEQPKMTSWLCDRMVHTKCAGFRGKKGKNLNYCCNACLVVANEMKSFMRQTKGGLKELINSFGVTRDSFRQADDLLSSLNSQFYALKLLDESPKRKKAAKDSELSALVSQPVIPPVPISLPPQGNIESGLPAQVGTSEIQSAGPKPLAVVPLKKQIFVSHISPDQTSSDVLAYIS